jgi:hypothetical protein
VLAILDRGFEPGAAKEKVPRIGRSRSIVDGGRQAPAKLDAHDVR